MARKSDPKADAQKKARAANAAPARSKTAPAFGQIFEVPLGTSEKPRAIVVNGTARRGTKSVAVDDSTATAESLMAYKFKSTFNTSDIMHAPVEKTLRMLEKIISGERLFTM